MSGGENRKNRAAYTREGRKQLFAVLQSARGSSGDSLIRFLYLMDCLFLLVLWAVTYRATLHFILVTKPCLFWLLIFIFHCNSIVCFWSYVIGRLCLTMNFMLILTFIRKVTQFLIHYIYMYSVGWQAFNYECSWNFNLPLVFVCQLSMTTDLFEFWHF